MPLSYPDYLDHIRAESARFATVLGACDPATPVPSCPEWTAADLVSHLTGVQWFWEQVVAGRPGPPPDDPDALRPARPAAYGDLLRTFDAQSASFQAVLAAADPEEPAWHWLPTGQSVGTSYRRQAHEVLIHRVDAEQVAGELTPLDPTLAADGVDEVLDWMYGGEPRDTVFTPTGGLVAVEATDTGDVVLVEPGTITSGPHLIVRPSGSPDATVRATAGELDAWLWHRVSDAGVALDGDPRLLDAFRAAVSPALD